MRDQTSRLVVGISLAGPAWLPVVEIDGVAKLVMHQADGISAALGFA